MQKRKKQTSSRPKRLPLPTDLFLQLLSDFSSISEVKKFFEDFFTSSEQEMFAKRLAVLLALKEGKSYEEIRKNYGVSSATISSVAENMSSDGMQLALQKVEHDQWADDMAEKVMKFFGWKK